MDVGMPPARGTRLTVDVAAADVNVYTPARHRSTGAWCGDVGSVVAIDYGTAAPPQQQQQQQQQQGDVHVTCTPYVLQRAVEDGMRGSDAAMARPSAPLVGQESRASAKQGLMEVLLGSIAAGETALSDPGGRPLPALSIADEVQARLRGSQCDATYVATPQLMVALIRVVLARRADPARSLVDCVTSVDLSHTQLGYVGPSGPPLHFDGNGAPTTPPPGAVATRFYPDEHVRRDLSSPEVKRAVAQRSLALTYVAPLLFIPGMRFYRVRELVCTHCGLTDADAHALALIIRVGDGHRSSRRGPAAFVRRRHSEPAACQSDCCVLEVLDISFNRITDAGMMELKRAIPHNTHLHTIALAGNDLRDPQKVLDDIERRLKRNRDGTTNSIWRRVQQWRNKLAK
ncbi:Leucine Rich repeat [Novymonas esmeraldas]|uniref:Leucine Rich repeat n=1 Tax=Novymonas esmeraldas TaxID=1808958 RepID=A0AAW0F6A8_9TRYP